MVRSRTRIAICAAAVTVAATFVVAPSPATASYFASGVSFSGRLVRDSVPYRLSVSAIEAMGSSYRLEMSISRFEDPAGATALRQKQTWVIPMEQGDFYREDNTYYIQVGAEGSAFHVDLALERRQDERCADGQPLFVTRAENGAFQIETDNDVFGTITELPECGRTWEHSSGQVPGPAPCPPEGQQLFAKWLTALERRGDDTVRVELVRSRSLVVSGDPVEWFVLLSGTLPGRRFHLDKRLEGALRAGRAPWLLGRVRIRAESELVRSRWYECRGDREARASSRFVSVRGDLTMDVIGYEDLTFRDRNALARRWRVRQS